MYIIQERYERYTNNGKEFTKWFRQLREYKTEKEAKDYISKCIKSINNCKHEYKIIKL